MTVILTEMKKGEFLMPLAATNVPPVGPLLRKRVDWSLRTEYKKSNSINLYIAGSP